MACIRKRRGKWVVDYRDAAGIRRWATCETRRAADIVLAERLDEARQPREPVVDPDIRLDEYSQRWLNLIRMSVKPRTQDSYQQTIRLHLLPVVGSVKVRTLARGRIKMFLATKLTSGLARNSVRIVHATLRAMLNAAVDDGVILANSADKLGRLLKLVTPAAARQEEIKAMTRDQVSAFVCATLAATNSQDRGCYPLFLLLARTGIRMGEAQALQWTDIDFRSREIRVVRALSAGRIESPKSGHGRTVDMSHQLTRALQRLQVERKAETLRQGWAEIPSWVFCTDAGTPVDGSRVRKAFARVLAAAGLPPHFTPHCLRHTFASLLLQQSESPAYVQRQLGHASIKLTVDTYGKWLPMGNKAAVDRLDDSSGSKVVAIQESGKVGAAEVTELDGAGGGS
jgi:integrase